jgi:hypothetical protein
VRPDQRFDAAAWERQDLEEQFRRLRTVPIEQRLQEVIAWSAVLLADELERSAGRSRVQPPHPMGLGPRRP